MGDMNGKLAVVPSVRDMAIQACSSPPSAYNQVLHDASMGLAYGLETGAVVGGTVGVLGGPLTALQGAVGAGAVGGLVGFAGGTVVGVVRATLGYRTALPADGLCVARYEKSINDFKARSVSGSVPTAM
jgi:hypothetical protein